MKQLFHFNRIVYLLFTIVGLAYALIWRNFSQATIFLGIALAFDPFDATVKWQDRPLYQKLIPIIQVAITTALLGLEIGRAGKS